MAERPNYEAKHNEIYLIIMVIYQNDPIRYPYLCGVKNTEIPIF